MLDLEADAAVEVLSDGLLQDHGAAGGQLQADGQSDGLGGAVDLGAEGFLFAACHLGADSHCKDPAKQRKDSARLKLSSSSCHNVAVSY